VAAVELVAVWRRTLQRRGGGGAPPAWRQQSNDGRRQSDDGRDADLQREDGVSGGGGRAGRVRRRRRESSPETGTASAGSLPASFSDSANVLSSFCDLGGSGEEEARSYICRGHWSRFMPSTGTVDPLVPVGGMNGDQ
jgi:hypothetical protein